MTLTYEKVIDYLPAYAIGALETEEQDAVDEYFRLQDELRQKLTSAQVASTLLAQGIDDAALPMDAKDRVMTRVLAGTPVASLAADMPSSKSESIDKIDDDKIDDDKIDDDKSGDHATADRVDGIPERSTSERKPIALPLTRKKSERRPLVQRVDSGSAVGKRPDLSREAQSAKSAQASSAQAHTTSTSSGATSSGATSSGATSSGATSSGVGKSTDPHKRRRVHQEQRAGGTDKSQPDHLFFFGLFNKRSLLNAALAASVAALILLGGLSSQLYNQTRELSQQSIALRGQNLELMAANTQMQSEQATLLRDYTDLETIYQETAVERLALINEKSQLQNQIAVSSERITLVGAASQATVMFGTDEAPGLQGTFFHRNEEGALVVHGLKPLPSDQTYQFWLVTESGEQVSAGLFAVSENVEPTWASLVLPQNAPAYNVVGVSVEPATGSVAPTGPMLLESAIERAESSS